MATESNAAAPQPTATQVAPTSGETKSNGGSDNLTGAQLTQRFMRAAERSAQPVATQEAPAETPTPPENQPVATEDASSVPAEAPVAEEAPKAEPEAKADEVLSPKTHFTPEQQEVFNKRLGKEVAKTKALEQEAQTLRQQLAAMKLAPEPTPQPAPAPLPSPSRPLAHIENVAELVSLQRQAKEAIRWGEEQLDRDDFDQAPPINPATNQPFTRGQIKAAMRNARITMEDEIPAQANFITAKQQAYQEALKTFPYLADRSSPEYQQAQAAKSQYPWLRDLPNADFIIGVQMEGMKALQARQAAAQAAAETKPVPPKSTVKPLGSQAATSSGSSGNRVPGQTAARQASAQDREALKSKGSVSGRDYASYLARQEQLRNTR